MRWLAAIFLLAIAAPAHAETPHMIQDCAACPPMVALPKGSFLMGSLASEPGRSKTEGPRHKVTIAYPLAIARHETTFDEWDACVADGGCGGHVADDDGY